MSVLALTLWTMLSHPPAPPFVTSLGEWPLVVFLAGILAFPAVNAVAEEFFYRGVVPTELTRALGAAPAIILQAAAFGIAHWDGFPSGWTGIGLSIVFGAMLGVTRHRSASIPPGVEALVVSYLATTDHRRRNWLA